MTRCVQIHLSEHHSINADNGHHAVICNLAVYVLVIFFLNTIIASFHYIDLCCSFYITVIYLNSFIILIRMHRYTYGYVEHYLFIEGAFDSIYNVE